MKRYFITGHSGFIGKHLREKLHGHTFLFDRGGDVEAIIKFQPDVIYHLAGEIYEESEMFDSNIALTYKILEVAKQLPNLQALIYIGSSSEYGRKDHPMSEIDYLNPSNMYEATKGAGTLLCQAYARSYGVPVVIARPFSVYGNYEPGHRFIPVVIRAVNKRKKIKLAPGVHDFIHIDDFVRGLLLLEENPKLGEIYNFGTGVQTSNAEVVGMIEGIIGKRSKLEHIPALHSYDSECWVANIDKAVSIGWKPEISLVEGLSRVVKDIKTGDYCVKYRT